MSKSKVFFKDQLMSRFLLDSCSAVEDAPPLVEEGGAAVIRGDL